MKELRKIIVSGGGTGGHIMPAIALCEALRDKYPELKIIFAGREDSMEERLAEKYALPFYPIPSAPKGRGFKTIKNFFVNLAGFIKSLATIILVHPGKVVAFGGYTSAPLILASLAAWRDSVIHESNAIPGRVTRLMAKLGARVACGLPSSHPIMLKLKESKKKANSFSVTGNPLRKEFFEERDDIGKLLPGYDAERPMLLVFGGSQGAHRINMLISGALPRLKSALPELQIVHVCGENDEETLRAAYENVGLNYWLFPFLNGMATVMRRSSLTVARSGAMSVSEICASSLPAILIPLPFAADGHQLANAKCLEEAGAALVREEKDLNPELLSKDIIGLLKDRERLQKMAEAGSHICSREASEKLIDFIEAV